MSEFIITERIARTVLIVVDAGLVSGLGEPIPGQMCIEAAVCYALGLPHGDDPSCVSSPLRVLNLRLNDSVWSSPAARAAGLRRLSVVQLGSAHALDEQEFTKRLVDYAIRVSAPKALRAAALVCIDHQSALLKAADSCEAEGTHKAAYAAYYAAWPAAAASDAASAAYYAAFDAAWAASASAADDAEVAADYVASAAADAADAAADAADAEATAADAAHDYAADADAVIRDKSLAEYAEAIVKILIDMKAPGCQWLPLTV